MGSKNTKLENVKVYNAMVAQTKVKGITTVRIFVSDLDNKKSYIGILGVKGLISFYLYEGSDIDKDYDKDCLKAGFIFGGRDLFEFRAHILAYFKEHNLILHTKQGIL